MTRYSIFEMNPKDSYIYREAIQNVYTTLKGSYIIDKMIFYKYATPSGLIYN